MILNFEKILAKVLQPLMQRRDYGGNQLFKQVQNEKESSITKRRRNGNWHTKSNNVSENLKRKFNTHEINF